MDNKNYIFTGKDKDDISTLQNLYELYYSFLCFLAEKIVSESSEDVSLIVDNVFMELWEKRDNGLVLSKPKKYLGEKVIINACLYVNELNIYFGSRQKNLLFMNNAQNVS